MPAFDHDNKCVKDVREFGDEFGCFAALVEEDYYVVSLDPNPDDGCDNEVLISRNI